MTDAAAPYQVTIADGSEDNGLALMLAPLIQQNVAQHPWKAASLARLAGDVVITARDEDSAVVVTLAFDRAARTLTLRDGAAARPRLHVQASYEDVILLSQLPIRGGLPALHSPEGRTFLRKLARGEIRVGGMWTHPLTLVRLARVMSVAG